MYLSRNIGDETPREDEPPVTGVPETIFVLNNQVKYEFLLIDRSG